MKAKTNQQITQCTKSLNVLSCGGVLMNSVTNYLLNNSFYLLISLIISIGQRCWFNQNNTFHLSYINAFDIYNGLWNLIGSVFLMRELTHKKIKQSTEDHNTHIKVALSHIWKMDPVQMNISFEMQSSSVSSLHGEGMLWDNSKVIS